MSTDSISWSSISGWRRYQSSICSRRVSSDSTMPGERRVAVGGEIGVFVRGPYEPAEAVDHRVTLGTEVARTRLLHRAGKQFVNVHGKPPAHVTLPA